MPKAQLVNSIRLGVAERTDIILDFSQYQEGDIIYLENKLESKAPSEDTSGKILASGTGTELLQFRVGKVAADYSAPMKIIQTQTMVPFPVRPVPKVKRSFSFGSSNGAWNVNGKYYNPLVMSAYPAEGSCEEWEFSSGGGWSHPIHVHHEEGQVVKRDGKAPVLDDLSRKDVYRVGDGSVGTSNTGKLSIQMQFRDYYGDYVCHCHNVRHPDL
jgi:FtsP/CotA-like multicopper oxidase with cupredoxin domain